MEISYTWSITQMSAYPYVQGNTDVVFTASWNLSGTDGVYLGSCYGSTSFPLPNDGSQFTPYNQLTQDQVLSWIFEAMGPEQVLEYENNVSTQIANQVTPPIVTPPLPWAQALGPTPV